MANKIPNVTFDDVCDDKEFITAIRSAMEPAIDAMVYRAAMIAKQFALSAIQTKTTESKSDEATIHSELYRMAGN